MQVIFNSTKNPHHKRTLYAKTKSVDITDKVIDELFNLLIQGCKDLF